MAKITVGQSVVLKCPYEHTAEKYTDNTIQGTQEWTLSDDSLAALADMGDGSMTLSALAVGVLDVSYSAFGLDEQGAKVALENTKQFTITAIPEDEPEPIPAIVKPEIIAVRE